MSNYPAEERETSLIVDDANKTWSCYTLMQSMISKFKKAGIKPTEVKSDGEHVYRNIPYACISIRSVSTKKRKPMSEEHKQKLLEGRKKNK